MKNLNEYNEDFFSFQTIRHQKAKPPKEAYFLFPKLDEIIIHDSKNPNKTLRRILEGNVKLLKFEEDKINELNRKNVHTINYFYSILHF